jgi:hypothetical protein
MVPSFAAAAVRMRRTPHNKVKAGNVGITLPNLHDLDVH